MLSAHAQDHRTRKVARIAMIDSSLSLKWFLIELAEASGDSCPTMISWSDTDAEPVRRDPGEVKDKYMSRAFVKSVISWAMPAKKEAQNAAQRDLF